MPITKSGKSADLTNLTLNPADIPSLSQLPILFKQNKPAISKSIAILKRMDSRLLDEVVHDLHEQAFANYDCLVCANCCRTISPAMSSSDVDDIAKKLRIKAAEVVTRHMHMDDDGDYVFNSAPCPYIDKDNLCRVYSHRPKACREYPHTDRRRFTQILDLSLKNSAVCPVVYAILMKLSIS